MRHGFTLLELLAVLTMVGVLTALGTPRLKHAFDRLAVGQAVNEVTAFYNTARLAAVLRSRRVRIEFAGDTLRAVFEGVTDSTFLLAAGPDAHGVVLTASRPIIRIQATGLGVGAANTKLVFRRGQAGDSLATSRLGRMRRMRSGQ